MQSRTGWVKSYPNQMVEGSCLRRGRLLSPFKEDLTLEDKCACEVPRLKELDFEGPTVAGQVRGGQLPADCLEQGGEDPDAVGRAEPRLIDPGLEILYEVLMGGLRTRCLVSRHGQIQGSHRGLEELAFVNGL